MLPSLLALATPTRRVHLQWVPFHCGMREGGGRADAVAKEAGALPQAHAPVDVVTVWGDRLPSSVTAGDLDNICI